MKCRSRLLIDGKFSSKYYHFEELSTMLVIDILEVSSNYHVIVHETPGNPCFSLLKGMATTGYMQGSLKYLTEGTEYLECDVMGNIFIEAIII